ncbi:MAG TPA: CsiV family protein [Steroidobacteraceae bacterium]|nr:CsiV family protein [Steroidobacteraceae bacterium]
MNWRLLALAALCALPIARAQQPANVAVQAPAVPTAAATAPTATPGAPEYNVELIVFRATAAQSGAEAWASEAQADGPLGDLDSDAPGPAAPGAGEGRFLRLLAGGEMQLSGIESRLRASGAYVPVAHAAWSQTANPWGNHAGIPLQRLGVDVPGLNGTVTLERGTFLHLALSLNYAMEDPPAGLGAAPGTMFTMHDSHRVRFYERNYFDHPAFGVIALVTPVQGSRSGR